MPSIPGVHVVTLQSPVRYTQAQIEKACQVAYALGRGRFLLLEPPAEQD